MPYEPLQFDEHGQPRNRAINAKKLKQRGVNELIGICKGIVAEKNVSTSEAKFLFDWLLSHDDVAQDFPGNIIYARIYDFLRDGVIDNDENNELIGIVTDLSGHIHNNESRLSLNISFDDVGKSIQIENKVFCLTGRFAFGTRHLCEEEIKNLGGWVNDWPRRSTDYLVIGTFASRDWKHSSFGQKIEDAFTIRQTHRFPLIIPESVWTESLARGE